VRLQDVFILIVAGLVIAYCYHTWVDLQAMAAAAR
jgi:hypothetical protein